MFLEVRIYINDLEKMSDWTGSIRAENGTYSRTMILVCNLAASLVFGSDGKSHYVLQASCNFRI
jgi:hypothetical protein